MFFHNFHRISCRLTAMDHHRFVHLSRKIQLSDEPMFLQIMPFFIPIIIKSDLANRNDLFFL